MTLRERMDAFWAGVGQLAEQLEFKRVTFHIQVQDGLGVSTWWPGCPSDCQHPAKCSAIAFDETARHLIGRIEVLAQHDEGEIPGVIDGRTTGSFKN